LGYVHKDFWTPGTELVIKHSGAAIPATVAELPFVRAEETTAPDP
jgi:glycine cleavage system aminomethyltransferase T